MGRVTEFAWGSNVEKYFWDTGANGIGKLYYSSSSSGIFKVFLFNGSGQLAALETQFSGLTLRTSFTYNANGQLDSLDYPASTALKVRYTYQNGFVKSVTDPQSGDVFWARDTLTPSSESEHWGNGISSARVFDSATGLLKSISTGTANSLQGLSFLYTPTGELSSRADSATGISEGFAYDSLGRLEQWKRAGGGKSWRREFSFDDFGTMTQARDYRALTGGSLAKTTTFTLGGSGGASLLGVSSDGRFDYAYDKDGRQTKRLYGEDREVDREITYNSWDLPTQLRPAVGPATTFKYDADGVRVSKKTGAYTTYYSPDSLTEVRDDGSAARQFVSHVVVEGRTVADVVDDGWLDDGSFYLSKRTKSYLHADDMGSPAVRSFVSAAEPVERSLFEPFGRRVGMDGTDSTPSFSPNHQGFTGHEHDDELGLINMRGRMYDPALRRFLTPDPIVQSPHYSQGHQPYSYAHNRPTRFTDPSGKCTAGARGSDQFASGGGSLSWTCGQVDDPSLKGEPAEVINGPTVTGDADSDQIPNPAATTSAVEFDAGASDATGATSPGAVPSVGFGLGVAQGMVPFGIATEVVRNRGTAEGERAVALGQILGGLAALLEGAAEIGGGGLLAVTGVGTLPGVGVAVVGVVTVGGALTNVGVGIYNMATAGSGGGKAGGTTALGEAGQALDRGGLTKAGRALEKHGGRAGSVFSKASGNIGAKNAQGQAALDDILGNISKTSPNKLGGNDYFGGTRGGGARFDAAGNFIGFLEP